MSPPRKPAPARAIGAHSVSWLAPGRTCLRPAMQKCETNPFRCPTQTKSTHLQLLPNKPSPISRGPCPAARRHARTAALVGNIRNEPIPRVGAPSKNLSPRRNADIWNEPILRSNANKMNYLQILSDEPSPISGGLLPAARSAPAAVKHAEAAALPGKHAERTQFRARPSPGRTPNRPIPSK
jgi:hypothetical protein